MTTKDTILLEFEVHAYPINGGVYYDVPTAEAIARRCMDLGVGVCHVQGFLADNGDVTPVEGALGDFSGSPDYPWTQHVEVCAMSALRLLGEWHRQSPQFKVALTMKLEEEWASASQPENEEDDGLADRVA